MQRAAQPPGVVPLCCVAHFICEFPPDPGRPIPGPRRFRTPIAPNLR
jgi:hypothetical protein